MSPRRFTLGPELSQAAPARPNQSLVSAAAGQHVHPFPV